MTNETKPKTPTKRHYGLNAETREAIESFGRLTGFHRERVPGLTGFRPLEGTAKPIRYVIYFGLISFALELTFLAYWEIKPAYDTWRARSRAVETAPPPRDIPETHRRETS